MLFKQDLLYRKRRGITSIKETEKEINQTIGFMGRSPNRKRNRPK